MTLDLHNAPNDRAVWSIAHHPLLSFPDHDGCLNLLPSGYDAACQSCFLPLCYGNAHLGEALKASGLTPQNIIGQWIEAQGHPQRERLLQIFNALFSILLRLSVPVWVNRG